MRAKGRGFFNLFPLGTAHPKAKMDPERVRRIRAMHGGGLSVAKIGAVFGLHPSTVHDIATRRTWRHVA